jgi:hypothetical protein
MGIALTQNTFAADTMGQAADQTQAQFRNQAQQQQFNQNQNPNQISDQSTMAQPRAVRGDAYREGYNTGYGSSDGQYWDGQRWQTGYAKSAAPGKTRAQYEAECPQDHACEDQSMNECYCLMVHYKPCYYTTCRTEEYQVPCQRKCCRTVPKYCEVQKCRMVPEYYTETQCYEEQEEYYVEDCKTCYRQVEDCHCQYVPEYYWKHTCGNPECPNK